MKMMKRMKHSLSYLLCMMLIVAMALSVSGCSDDKKVQEDSTSKQEETAKATVIGEGATVFAFEVVDLEGTQTSFEVHTDETMVGAALLNAGLIAGDNSEYGLYVKKVNGIELDFEKDGAYWAFYVDGEYAMSGVDTTEIAEGSAYMFKAEKS